MGNTIKRNAIELHCTSLVKSSAHEQGEQFTATKQEDGRWTTEKNGVIYRLFLSHLRNEHFISIDNMVLSR